MIHVVLDTCIYRHNPSRDNLHFKALEGLSKASSIRLHIPYIILREFQTQQKEEYKKNLTKITKGLSDLIRKKLDSGIHDKLETLKEELNNESENILSNAENQITQWAEDIGANIYPICIDQANAALEAYFNGDPPLKSAKTRNDIPDSFIVQSIHNLNSENNGIHIVCDDAKIRDAFSGEETISTYNCLADFIESELIQNALKDIDVLDNISLVADAIQQYENEESEISSFISNNIGESILSRPITGQSFFDGTNEAIISNYSDAENIILDFSETYYYGNGKFGIPFSLKIVVSATYYISKSEYYYMELGREHSPPVTEDLSDHYFEVEDEFELNVFGLVSITGDKDNIDLDEFPKSIIEDCIKIDEISSIEINFEPSELI